MSWDEFNSSYNWAKILDGETQKIVIVGEPEVQEKPDESLSILFNVFNADKGIHEVLRCGVILSGKIKGALKGGTLAGKVVLAVSRTGSGMDDTVYVVRAEEMTKEIKEEVSKVEPHDLSKIPLPEEKKGRNKKRNKKAKK